jgi:hypothetical protein
MRVKGAHSPNLAPHCGYDDQRDSVHGFLNELTINRSSHPLESSSIETNDSGLAFRLRLHYRRQSYRVGSLGHPVANRTYLVPLA